MSHSRRRRSPSPAKPHHAGVAYRMDATVVALATRWSSCGWRPWVRRSLNANIEEEQVFKTCETWSLMVNLTLRWTPRTLSVITLSAPFLPFFILGVNVFYIYGSFRVSETYGYIHSRQSSPFICF